VIRNIFVFLHRWVGLVMAVFLIIVGLTGSLLAFNKELDEFFGRVFAPQMYAAPRLGEPRLDIATLWERAAPLVQHARVTNVTLSDERVLVGFNADVDPATGKPYDLGFSRLYVDPWTGAELGRSTKGDISEGMINFMPFVYKLHKALLLEETGKLILGIVALLWTFDCFVGFYLTLPVSRSGFWRKWKTAWAVKRGAGAYRLNLDLHRASGLWVWPMLLVFAWSSVMFNMKPAYDWTMSKLMSSRSTIDELKETMKKTMEMPEGAAKPVPALAPRAALEAAQRLAAEQAKAQGRDAPEPKSLAYLDRGVYFYSVRHPQRMGESAQKGGLVMIDGDTGALVGVPPMFSNPEAIRPSTRDVVDILLVSLHEAQLFGLPYKIFVSVLGLAIAMLSVTGVYIWWKKRKARRFHKTRGASAGAALEATVGE